VLQGARDKLVLQGNRKHDQLIFIAWFEFRHRFLYLIEPYSFALDSPTFSTVSTAGVIVPEGVLPEWDREAWRWGGCRFCLRAGPRSVPGRSINLFSMDGGALPLNHPTIKQHKRLWKDGDLPKPFSYQSLFSQTMTTAAHRWAALLTIEIQIVTTL
jgi:hypothetical protein